MGRPVGRRVGGSARRRRTRPCARTRSGCSRWPRWARPTTCSTSAAGRGETTRARARALAVDGHVRSASTSRPRCSTGPASVPPRKASPTRVRAGRRAGAPVPGRVVRRRREPLRRDVLRRSGGRVRQHRPGDGARRPARGGGVAGLRPQRMAAGAMARPLAMGRAVRDPRSPAPPARSGLADPDRVRARARGRRVHAASQLEDLAVPFWFGDDADAAVAVRRGTSA